MAKPFAIAYDNRSEPEGDDINDDVIEMLKSDFEQDFTEYLDFDAELLRELLLKICIGTATLEDTQAFKKECRDAYQSAEERFVDENYDDRVVDLYDYDPT